MILDHVTDGSCLIVEGAAALYAKVLRHRDLYAFDVIAIPERFQEGVREAKGDHVVDRAFGEVVIDAEDGAFRKSVEQNAIQFASRGEIVSEGLLDDHAGSLRGS